MENSNVEFGRPERTIISILLNFAPSYEHDRYLYSTSIVGGSGGIAIKDKQLLDAENLALADQKLLSKHSKRDGWFEVAEVTKLYKQTSIKGGFLKREYLATLHKKGIIEKGRKDCAWRKRLGRKSHQNVVRLKQNLPVLEVLYGLYLPHDCDLLFGSDYYFALNKGVRLHHPAKYAQYFVRTSEFRGNSERFFLNELYMDSEHFAEYERFAMFTPQLFKEFLSLRPGEETSDFIQFLENATGIKDRKDLTLLLMTSGIFTHMMNSFRHNRDVAIADTSWYRKHIGLTYDRLVLNKKVSGMLSALEKNQTGGNSG